MSAVPAAPGSTAPGAVARLADLSVGARARVVRLEGKPAVVARLLEMGLTEGAEVRVVRFAPLGDPLEVRLRGYSLSLRREDARGVVVAPL